MAYINHKTAMTSLFNLVAASSLLMLIACVEGSKTDGPTDEQLSWSSGVFEDQTIYQDYCEMPRSGTDINGDSFPDKQGSTLHENHFLRAWSNNTYLWYDEIIDVDPSLYSSSLEYFNQLVTTGLSPSGNPKDNFHFTYNSADWLQLSQAGISAGYGIHWTIINSTPPREVRVAYIEEGTAASTASILRGEEVIEIDGIDVVNANDSQSIDLINDALFPRNLNQTHQFVLRDINTNETRTVSLTSSNITSTPVKNVTSFDTDTGKVGYLLFNSHIQTAEQGLFDAITELSNQNISDLVLDLRYNGGGLLAIASQLSYMIAGSIATNGKTFEQIVFNDKHTSTNPVTGESLSPTPFYNQSVGFSVAAGQPLPSLNLERVFILSTARTCSASEAIINGLRGINIEVILIGSTTCGKPYGFYPQDNCGTTYFTIQFKGENELGFGDYSDGFTPANSNGTVGELVTGCSVADDFTNTLGDPAESQLAAALNYRDTGNCPTPTGTGKTALGNRNKSESQDASLFNSEIYRNYILLRESRINDL